MDQWEQFAKNLTDARGGDKGNIYENRAFARIDMSEGANAIGKAKTQAAIDETNRGNAVIDAKLDVDRKDPSKARMVMRPDHSGYDFFNGANEKIDINQFSLLTGARPNEILADSDNPRDQQFVSDYSTMKDISNAWINGDTEKLAAYRQADPDKFNELVSRYKSPQEMVSAFMQYYSDYYGNTSNANANSARFSPGAPAQSEGGYGPGRTVTLTDPNNPKKVLGNTNLTQVVTPTIAAPKDTRSVWQKYNPWSGASDELRRQEEAIKNDPWSSYYSSLTGK